MSTQAAKKPGSSFKDIYGAESTFTGGTKYPEEIGIVGLDPSHPLYIKGVDLPLEDWNEACWDSARLAESSHDYVPAKAILATVNAGGEIPTIEVTRLRGHTLITEGRRRLLGCRAANVLIRKQGTTGADLILIPFKPSKAQDVEVSIRIANEGRLEDPPWVKAHNSARLSARGKSDETIMGIFSIQATTLTNWRHFLDLCPEVQALVIKDPTPEAVYPMDFRLPFRAAYEIGKLGKGESTKQLLAIHCLRNMGAQLTAEIGANNARQVVRSIKDGTLTTPPPRGAQVAPQGDEEDEGPDSSPPAPGGGSRGPKAGGVVAQSGRMTTGQIRQAVKAFESIDDKDEVERVIFSVLAVLTGADPEARFLEEAPRAQEIFRKILGYVAPKAPEKVTAPSTDRPHPCPNPACDRGVDKSKGKGAPCQKCKGFGKCKNPKGDG